MRMQTNIFNNSTFIYSLNTILKTFDYIYIGHKQSEENKYSTKYT